MGNANLKQRVVGVVRGYEVSVAVAIWTKNALGNTGLFRAVTTFLQEVGEAFGDLLAR